MKTLCSSFLLMTPHKHNVDVYFFFEVSNCCVASSPWPTRLSGKCCWCIWWQWVGVSRASNPGHCHRWLSNRREDGLAVVGLVVFRVLVRDLGFQLVVVTSNQQHGSKAKCGANGLSRKLCKDFLRRNRSDSQRLKTRKEQTKSVVATTNQPDR